MVVINKDGVVYIAESSYYMPLFSTERDFLNYPENKSVWHPNGEADKLILVAGSRREADLLKYKDIFPKPFNAKKIIDDTYYKTAILLEEAGLTDDKRCPRCAIVFAKKDKAYVMMPNTAVERIEEIFADSIDNDVVIGEYFLNKDKPIKELLRGMYKSIEDATMKKQFPVAVMNTRTRDIEYIYREELV